MKSVGMDKTESEGGLLCQICLSTRGAKNRLQYFTSWQSADTTEYETVWWCPVCDNYFGGDALHKLEPVQE